jgi:hypothetical protein
MRRGEGWDGGAASKTRGGAAGDTVSMRPPPNLPPSGGGMAPTLYYCNKTQTFFGIVIKLS